jgi:hypothetical protein
MRHLLKPGCRVIVNYPNTPIFDGKIAKVIRYQAEPIEAGYIVKFDNLDHLQNVNDKYGFLFSLHSLEVIP